MAICNLAGKFPRTPQLFKIIKFVAKLYSLENNIAYHEAGHAVAAIENGIKFHHVTIIRDEEKNSLGHILLSKLLLISDFDDSPRTRLKAEKFIQVALAGPIAEEKYTGILNRVGSSQDFEQSFAVAANLFGQTKVIARFIDFLWEDTRSMFTYSDENEQFDLPLWDEVKILAGALLTSKKLMYKEVIKILNK